MWQALVVSGQDIYKVDVIVQCQGIFYKFRCLGKDYVEASNFCVEVKKYMKSIKEFK